MSKVKRRPYLSAYVPEVPKQAAKRRSEDSSDRIDALEEFLESISDAMAKNNRDNLDAMNNIGVSNLSASAKRLLQSYEDGIVSAHASIEAWANEQEAGFQAIAEWQNDTTESIASIKGTADANGATIELLTKFKKEVEDGTIESIASIRQQATEQGASIEMLTQFKKDVEDGSVESIAKLKQQATEQGASIELLAEFKKDVEDGTIESIASIKEAATENGAAIELLTEFKKDVEDGTIESIASIKEQATEQGASIELLTEFKKDVENGTVESISSIKEQATENGAAIELLTEFKKDVEDGTVESIASIKEQATENGAAIEMLTEFKKEVEDGTVESIASIRQTTTEQGSAIEMLSQFKKDVEDGTVKSIASIKNTADENSAKIESITKWQGEVDGKFTETEAKLTSLSSEDEALNELVVKYRNEYVTANSTLTQRVDANETSIEQTNVYVSQNTAAISEIKEELTAGGVYYEEIRKYVDEQDGKINSTVSGHTETLNSQGGQITDLLTFQSSVNNGTNTGINNSISTATAAVQKNVDANSARIDSLAAWQGTVDSDIDSLQSTTAETRLIADTNGANITQIVTAVGSNGDVTAASIVAAVNSAGSSVKISADHVDISGFVTFSNLSEDGESTVNGNNISLLINADDDDGSSSLSSRNGLNFMYTGTGIEVEEKVGKIYTLIDNTDTDTTSRAALVLETYQFEDILGTHHQAALKMISYGRTSIESRKQIYISTGTSDAVITLDAADNTRIFANRDYTQMATSGKTGYCFCTDGIYYDGELILST